MPDLLLSAVTPINAKVGLFDEILQTEHLSYTSRVPVINYQYLVVNPQLSFFKVHNYVLSLFRPGLEAQVQESSKDLYWF